MFTIVFSWYLLGRRVAESPRPRPFKPNRPRIFRQQFMSFEKKNTFTHGAPGSQFMCAPYSTDTLWDNVLVRAPGVSHIYRFTVTPHTPHVNNILVPGEMNSPSFLLSTLADWMWTKSFFVAKKEGRRSHFILHKLKQKEKTISMLIPCNFLEWKLQIEN